MWAILISLSLTQTPDQSAAAAIAAANADLARLPASVRISTRYLSLHTIPEKDRPEATRVLAGHVQHLSRASDITRPGSVAGGTLLRVNLLDYGWTPELWERLHDPYFTVASGKEAHPAPWLGDRETLAEVVAWTGSWVPVVDAGFFFRQTATSADGRLYYEFLGIKDEATFHKLVGFDRKASEGFRFELRESVAISGVTLKPRAITRHDTLGGSLWRSLDFSSVKDKKHPLRTLGRDLEKLYDATEQFGHLPNGMWATWIGDSKGKSQDFAPPDIAGDHTSTSNDKRVLSGISCFRCHSDGGLKPVDGFFRKLLNPPLELRTYDGEKAREYRAQYLRHLEGFLKKDRLIYEAAIKEATGWDSKTFSAKLGAFWNATENATVNTTTAARLLGVEEKELNRKLLAWIKGGYYLDPVAATLVQPRAQPILIADFEEVIPIIQDVLRKMK